MPDLISFATALPVADHGDWGPGPWFLLVPLVWVAIIVTVIWLIRGARAGRGWGPPGGAPSAMEILDRRFAEGEISAEEYRERRGTLSRQDG